MEEYGLYELAQMIHTSGDTFLNVLLGGLGCGHNAGTYSEDDISIPMPPIDGRVHMVAMETRDHAFALAIDTRDMTATILDPSMPEGAHYHQDIMDYLSDHGYAYKYHGCPRSGLPQQDDHLCALWTLYLIYETCRGIDPVDVIYRVDSPGMRQFMEYARYLFTMSGLETSYRRLLSYIVNHLLNDIPINMARTFTLYKEAKDKETFMDTIDRPFPIEDRCIRYLHSYEFIVGILTVANRWFHIPRDIASPLSQACTVSDIVGVIASTLPPTDARGILFLGLLWVLDVDIFTMDTHMIEGLLRVYPPEVRDIMDRYLLSHISSVLEVGDMLGIHPSGYDSAIAYMGAIYTRRNAIMDMLG